MIIPSGMPAEGKKIEMPVYWGSGLADLEP
jgi:hypothetical protein